MKKIISVVLVLILTFSVGIAAMASDNAETQIPIKLVADNKIVKTDNVVVKERTLVPLRALAEAFDGVKVNWINETKEAIVEGYGKKLTLQIGNKTMKTPDGVKELDVAPILHNGTTTYVPVRAIFEELGLSVDWDNGSKTILVLSPDGCHHVDLYGGVTLEVLVESGTVDKDTFLENTSLDYEEYKGKTYTEAINDIPLPQYAKLCGLTVSELKQMLMLDESYPDDATWGEATGDTAFGVYLYIVEGLYEEGHSLNETVESVKQAYGLDSGFSANTPFKFVRTFLYTALVEMQEKAQ